MIIFIPIALVLCMVLGLYIHLKRHFGVFKRLGVPGPEPSILFGNLLDMRRHGHFQVMREWSKKYGRVFGYFEGYTPVMSISDPEILKEVLVKDFHNYQSRKHFSLAPKKSLGLFLENGLQWKRTRTLLTPAFSSGKLKQMYGVMDKAADIMVEQLGSRASEKKSFDVYAMFQCLTLDVIGRCAFGLQTAAQVNPNDPFLTHIRKLFNTMTRTLILPLVMLIPALSNVVFLIKNMVVLFGMNPVIWLRQQLKDVIRIRKDMGRNSSVIDLLQLMLFPETNRMRRGSDPNLERPLTEREVVAQAMTFLLAGYETSSAVLACLTHVLARHPEVQSKLAKEIEEHIGQGEVSYDTVQDLTYFDQVFDEVCRLYPTASLIVTRQADEERQYGDVIIPAGMNVHANLWSLHYDAEFWDEPERFDPDRFLPERRDDIQPFTFLPFGAGPRSCIGVRFATIETKITMTKILQKFQLMPAENGEGELELESRGAIVPKKAVNIRVVRRHRSNFRKAA